MLTFCKFFNIKIQEVAVFHPSSNRIVESQKKKINKLIRIYMAKIETHEWDMFLPTLQLTTNSSYNETLGDFPFYCLFGYDSPSETFNQLR